MPQYQPANQAKQYIRPAPTAWYLKRRSYFLVMLRELSCVFVGGYALFLLLLIARVGDVEAFTALLSSPVSVLFHIIALPFVLYHTITWFGLTPKAVVVYRGEDKVSPVLIVGAHYVAWLAVSAVLIWIVIASGSA